jgi:hypothetical protein
MILIWLRLPSYELACVDVSIIPDALLGKLGCSESSVSQRHECCRKATLLDRSQLHAVGQTSAFYAITELPSVRYTDAS